MDGIVFLLVIPIWCLFLIGVTVLTIFINMLVIAPYYSFIKRASLYYKWKKQKHLMKEQPQRFGHPENNESEQKNQTLNKKLHTGESVFSLKKWTAFSRKDYLIVSIISFMMIAVKVYVYIAFWNLVGKSIEDQLRIALVSVFLTVIVFVSVCVLVTLPVIFVLRAIVTFYLNRKLQRLEELKQ